MHREVLHEAAEQRARAAGQSHQAPPQERHTLDAAESALSRLQNSPIAGSSEVYDQLSAVDLRLPRCCIDSMPPVVDCGQVEVLSWTTELQDDVNDAVVPERGFLSCSLCCLVRHFSCCC